MSAHRLLQPIPPRIVRSEKVVDPSIDQGGRKRHHGNTMFVIVVTTPPEPTPVSTVADPNVATPEGDTCTMGTPTPRPAQGKLPPFLDRDHRARSPSEAFERGISCTRGAARASACRIHYEPPIASTPLDGVRMRDSSPSTDPSSQAFSHARVTHPLRGHAATAPPGAYMPSGHTTRSPSFDSARAASYAA